MLKFMEMASNYGNATQSPHLIRSCTLPSPDVSTELCRGFNLASAEYP